MTSNKIRDDAVISTKLLNAAVTTDKIHDLAVDTDKLGPFAVTTAKIANDAVITDIIGPLAVTTGKIDNLAVTNAKLGALAVDTAKLGAFAVTTDKLANNSVTNDIIAAGAVGNNELTDNCVTSDEINDGAVIESKIANGAVTSDKLAAGLIPEPGFHVAPGTYRKIQILPSNFVHPTGQTFKGIVTSGGISGASKFSASTYAYVTLPAGYKIVGFKVITYYDSGAQGTGFEHKTVAAQKVPMGNGTRTTLTDPQATNTTNVEVTLPSAGQVQFDAESFLLITVLHTSATETNVLGGWAKIEKV